MENKIQLNRSLNLLLWTDKSPTVSIEQRKILIQLNFTSHFLLLFFTLIVLWTFSISISIKTCNKSISFNLSDRIYKRKAFFSKFTSICFSKFNQFYQLFLNKFLFLLINNLIKNIKMHLFEFAFYTAGTLYALFCQQILIFYFLLIVGLYILISTIYPGARQISIRKKIMLGTWTPPSEGVITSKFNVRVDKVMKLIESLPKQNRPTLTHFVIKALGKLLHDCPDINGKLVFGKFVQYKTEDVCCLVDIDGGKDLAIVLVQDIQNKGVYDIAEFIKSKGQNIKKSKGDSDHKSRTGVAKLLPAFMVTVALKVSNFLFHVLNISIKPLAIKKNQFGAACLTSVGMIGFKDATAPFSGFTGCTFFVTLNAVQEAPVVEDGKVVVGRIANMNFAVDHRYIDGGKCKNLIVSFHSVFENPQAYLKVQKQKEQIKKQQ